jgi:hypothetical protein
MTCVLAVSVAVALLSAVSTGEPSDFVVVAMLVAGFIWQMYRDSRADRQREERDEKLASHVDNTAVALATKTDASKEEIVGKIDENTAITRAAWTAANNYNLKLLLLKKELAEQVALEQTKKIEEVDATTRDTNVTLHAAVDPKQ